MKKIVVLITIVLLITGCTSNVENNKIAYLEYKSELQKQETFIEKENVDFNTFFNIERENEELINYIMVIDNPNIDMYNIKALLIHDYVQYDVYPSSGIMDEPKDLIKGTNDKIELRGQIQTTDDISDINFKLYIEYIDNDGLKNKVYYQVSRG